MGRRIRAFRRRRGLSQTELSQLVGLTRSAVASYEVEVGRRVPSLPRLRSLAAALGVLVADLIAGVPNLPPEIAEPWPPDYDPSAPEPAPDVVGPSLADASQADRTQLLTRLWATLSHLDNRDLIFLLELADWLAKPR